MNIVIVEDEIRIREGITRLLNKFYPHIEHIYEAKSAEEGIALIRKIKPDIVITDIKMGAMDGLEMLSILFAQDKIRFKAIILSAYSEFDYAKKALTLGVKDYLVKPIDAEEFRIAIKHLEEEIAKDALDQLGYFGTFGSLENILQKILSGQISVDDELHRYLEKIHSINPEMPMAQFCVYLGKTWNESNRLAANIIQSMLIKEHQANDTLLFIPDKKMMLYVFVGERDFAALKKYLQDCVMKEVNSLSAVKAAFAFSEHCGIESFRTCFETMRINLSWNIIFGREKIISAIEISLIKPATPSYPINIEQKSIAYLCIGDFKHLHEEGQSFIRYFSEGMYNPNAVKKNVVRYFLGILQVMKEINFSVYEKINEQEIIEKITNAVTASELEDVLYSLFLSASRHDEMKTGLLVQKVLRMVDEYARDGITLEEVADELELSPDHISAQLVKELGVNFSTYIKTYRLNRAKELLIGTDLKLFEIAAQIGYQDAKYFGRVFKESENILPMDYRKQFR
jgi:two-component system response regulator YesN